MGFLDHSTNNIIVDAVLTDLGRKRLSQNNGSFSVVKFALGDDEVDYSLVQKFGLTIGREKIEKNTPIFEAQTSSSHALKYKLLSLSSQVETQLPNLTTSVNLPVSIPNTANSVSIPINQNAVGLSNFITPELQETVVMIRASTRFLDVLDSNSTVLNPVYATERDKMGIYRLVTTGNQAGGRSASFNLRPKASLIGNSTIYSTFGDSQGRIHSNVTVTGLLSGFQLNIPVTLERPAQA